MTASREHRTLELIHSWHQSYGPTFNMKLLRGDSIWTVDPKNVQAVLALKFKDFDLSPNRSRAFVPLLGSGIFTTNGAEWEHSRALLRPNFARNQIADIDVYERHVAALIRQIPRDGEMVDLQELSFRMVFLPFLRPSRPWTIPFIE